MAAFYVQLPPIFRDCSMRNGEPYSTPVAAASTWREGGAFSACRTKVGLLLLRIVLRNMMMLFCYSYIVAKFLLLV